MILLLVIEFVVAVLLVLLYYKVFELKGIKRYTKKNVPVDLKLFIQMEHVDTKKISYEKLMKIVMWINAIDIGIILLLTNLVKGLLLKILIAMPLCIGMIYLSYTVAGHILKKKGMTLNESKKGRK